MNNIVLAKGYTTVEKLEDVDLMHTAYHDKDELGRGGGFLDALMSKVHALNVKAT